MREWENNIRKVEPYVPGEQPKQDNVIKLNTNENPYPPTPKALEAANRFNMDRLRLYPDPEASDLVNAIADYYGMDKEQVFVGVGSDDVISMCFLHAVLCCNDFSGYVVKVRNFRVVKFHILKFHA